MQLIILGREKNLCLAEAESVFGDYEKLSDEAIIVNEEAPIKIDGLGGAIKIASILNRNAQNPKQDIIDHIASLHSGGKFNFGISYYGHKKYPKDLGVLVKNSLKKIGKSARYVQSKTDKVLNAASVTHNKLLTKGCEILIIESDKNELIIAQTTAVQDIDSYSKRDYDKPCRDRRVGMLPPKLSQIMINLAKPSTDSVIVDPFCGSGGLLMEAALFGYKSEGSDIADKMVSCSEANTQWLTKEYSGIINKPTIIGALDATTRAYEYAKYNVVTEGFLGENFVSRPTLAKIKGQLPQLQDLYLKFLEHLKMQPIKPSSIVISLPFWILDNQRYYLNIIDGISKMGYNIHEFKSVRASELLYYREGQFTGRQILLLT